MTDYLTLHDLVKGHSHAYLELPESYRADDVLQFYTDKAGVLYAEPKPDQVGVLGNWVMMWDGHEWK